MRAKVIVSGAGDWRYIDVVPQGAGKLESLEYLRGRENFALERTVACGDSGNDVLMLSGDNLSVAVGNSQPDLKEWVARQFAVGGAERAQRLLLTKACQADGILEGLATYGLL